MDFERHIFCWLYSTVQIDEPCLFCVKTMYDLYALIILTLPKHLHVKYSTLVYLKVILYFPENLSHLVPIVYPSYYELDIAIQSAGCYYFLSPLFSCLLLLMSN